MTTRNNTSYEILWNQQVYTQLEISLFKHAEYLLSALDRIKELEEVLEPYVGEVE